MKLTFKNLVVLVFCFLFFAVNLVFAQPTNLDKVRNQIGEPPLTKLSDVTGGARSPLETAVNWLIDIFWILAVAMVIWAAFLYLTAGENEEKISEAKKRLLYALISAGIAILSLSIDYIVFNLLTGRGSY